MIDAHLMFYDLSKVPNLSFLAKGISCLQLLQLRSQRAIVILRPFRECCDFRISENQIHYRKNLVPVAAPALKNLREMGGGDFDVIFQSKGIPN